MLRSRVPIRFVTAACIVGMAAACSVADSKFVDPGAIKAAAYAPPGSTPACASSLGSYSLPKTFLKLVVKQTGSARPRLELVGEQNKKAVVELRRADRVFTFCLDHLADPTSDDEIRIIKASGQEDDSYASSEEKKDRKKFVPAQSGADAKAGTGTQLLQWVVSNTVSQAEYISRVLARTAFIALSGKSNFTPLGARTNENGEPTRTLAVLEYDPFDAEDSTRTNLRLSELGFCLILENYTFDRPLTLDDYCSNPRTLPTKFNAAYQQYRSAPPVIRGIAYRPRINYGLLIFTRDPKAKGPWQLLRQERVALENIAPIVSVGINRSLFAARRVAMMFDMGVLKAMCLVKTSELESAVQVPYEIARSIIVLPTEIFEVKIGNVNDNIALVKAEKDLIAAQQSYLDFIGDETKKDFTSSLPKSVDPVPTIPNPNAVSVDASTIATMSELQSNILNNICKDAPLVIRPWTREQRKTAGGTL